MKYRVHATLIRFRLCWGGGGGKCNLHFSAPPPFLLGNQNHDSRRGPRDHKDRIDRAAFVFGDADFAFLGAAGGRAWCAT